MHREQAATALQSVSDAGYSVHAALTKSAHVAPYNKHRFYQVMRQSKTVLSPWGFGEVCWRDFEAILSGAILIKPDMSHCVTQPPVFVPEETYLPCRRDYADLEEIVARVVLDWVALRPMRRHAFNVLARSRRPSAIAAQLAAIVRPGLGSA